MIWPLIRLVALWSMPIAAAILGIILATRMKSRRAIIAWWLQSTLIFLAGIPVTIVGLFAVAIGIPSRHAVAGSERPFSDPRYTHLGSWQLVRLPWWCRPWDNAFDGLAGDKRGWYANWSLNRKLGYPSFLSMWIWAAFRNPANFWSRNMTGCDVTGSTVEVLYGPTEVDDSHPGLHMLLCTDAKGRKYPVVEICYPWPAFPKYGIYGRFGWKIKAAHAGTPAGSPPQDCIKGSVYRLSLWKGLA